MKRADRERADESLRIDPERLDAECREQARRVWRAGEKQADAKHRWNQAKSRLKVVEAELRLAISRAPDKHGFGDKKPTIPEIDAAVVVHRRYREAEAEVQNLEHYYDLREALTKAFVGRKGMLEKCVDLEMIHYRTELRRSGNPLVRRIVAESEAESARRPLRRRKP